MSDPVFDAVFIRSIGNEGGYVNNPRDPGGETKFGISKRSYPDVDIAGLTADAAKAIYWRDFWTKGHMDQMAPVLAFQVFDAAINHGLAPAIRMMQHSMGLAPDGVVGPITSAAIADCDPHKIAILIVAERLMLWPNLNTFDTFGAGWMRRAGQDLQYLVKDF
jgi:lysozyme family protein